MYIYVYIYRYIYIIHIYIESIGVLDDLLEDHDAFSHVRREIHPVQVRPCDQLGP